MIRQLGLRDVSGGEVVVIERPLYYELLSLATSLGDENIGDDQFWVNTLSFLRVVNNLTPLEMTLLFRQFDAMMTFVGENRRQVMQDFLRPLAQIGKENDSND